MQARFRDAILAAAAAERPRAVGYVNLHNFKAYNALVGHARGDAHLARVQRALQELGRTWRVAGDGFAVLGDGPSFFAELRASSWRLRAELGATEAWALVLEDGRRLTPVPWRSFRVICTPRCGAAEVPDGAEGGAASTTAPGAASTTPSGAALGAALDEAEARCEALRAEGAAEAAGFAPLGQRPWHGERRLAERTCPGCGAGAAELVAEEEDLGWARERCRRCGTRYERSDKLWVLGEEQDAAYM